MDCDAFEKLSQDLPDMNTEAIHLNFSTVPTKMLSQTHTKQLREVGTAVYSGEAYCEDLLNVGREICRRVNFHNEILSNPTSPMSSMYFPIVPNRPQELFITMNDVCTLLFTIGLPACWIKLVPRASNSNSDDSSLFGLNQSVQILELPNRQHSLWDEFSKYHLIGSCLDSPIPCKSILDLEHMLLQFPSIFAKNHARLKSIYFHIASSMMFLKWTQSVLFDSGKADCSVMDYARGIRELRMNKNMGLDRLNSFELSVTRWTSLHFIQEMAKEENQYDIQEYINRICDKSSEFGTTPMECYGSSYFFEPPHDLIISICAFIMAHRVFIPRIELLRGEHKGYWNGVLNECPNNNPEIFKTLVSYHGAALQDYFKLTTFSAKSFQVLLSPISLDSDMLGADGAQLTYEIITAFTERWKTFCRIIQKKPIIQLPDNYYIAFQYSAISEEPSLLPLTAVKWDRETLKLYFQDMIDKNQMPCDSTLQFSTDYLKYHHYDCYKYLMEKKESNHRIKIKPY